MLHACTAGTTEPSPVMPKDRFAVAPGASSWPRFAVMVTSSPCCSVSAIQLAQLSKAPPLTRNRSCQPAGVSPVFRTTNCPPAYHAVASDSSSEAETEPEPEPAVVGVGAARSSATAGSANRTDPASTQASAGSARGRDRRWGRDDIGRTPRVSGRSSHGPGVAGTSHVSEW